MNNLIKKVFSLLSKVLFVPEIERHTHCIYCGEVLTGNQRKFCNDKCNNTYYRKKYTDKRNNGFIKNLISFVRRLK